MRCTPPGLSDGPLRPNFKLSAGGFSTVNKGFVYWDEKQRQVVRLSKVGMGYGPVSILHVGVNMV